MTDEKILYGDDKQENRDALSRALKLRNLEVDLASTPQEFIEKARANKYLAFITDLEYSAKGREGYEVLKQIRQLPILKVLYSGASGFEYQAEAYENGADYAVLNKNESALITILDNQLKLGAENGN